MWAGLRSFLPAAQEAHTRVLASVQGLRSPCPRPQGACLPQPLRAHLLLTLPDPTLDPAPTSLLYLITKLQAPPPHPPTPHPHSLRTDALTVTPGPPASVEQLSPALLFLPAAHDSCPLPYLQLTPYQPPPPDPVPLAHLPAVTTAL